MKIPKDTVITTIEITNVKPIISITLYRDIIFKVGETINWAVPFPEARHYATDELKRIKRLIKKSEWNNVVMLGIVEVGTSFITTQDENSHFDRIYYANMLFTTKEFENFIENH